MKINDNFNNYILLFKNLFKLIKFILLKKYYKFIIINIKKFDYNFKNLYYFFKD